MESFIAAAQKNAVAFGKASDARTKADRSMTTIWLTLASVADVKKTAKEHYAVLPVQYTTNITEDSFVVTWSVARKCIVEINKREYTIADVVAAHGGLNAIKAFLFPKPVVDPATGKGGAVDKGGKTAETGKRADVVTTIDKAASVEALTIAAAALPTDKLAALHAKLGEILAERAASAKAA